MNNKMLEIIKQDLECANLSKEESRGIESDFQYECGYIAALERVLELNEIFKEE